MVNLDASEALATLSQHIGRDAGPGSDFEGIVAKIDAVQSPGQQRLVHNLFPRVGAAEPPVNPIHEPSCPKSAMARNTLTSTWRTQQSEDPLGRSWNDLSKNCETRLRNLEVECVPPSPSCNGPRYLQASLSTYCLSDLRWCRGQFGSPFGRSSRFSAQGLRSEASPKKLVPTLRIAPAPPVT